METPQQRLGMALTMARNNMPYLTCALFSMVLREAPWVERMAVTKRAVLLWNADYVRNTPLETLAAGVLHAIMHLLAKHHDRAETSSVQPDQREDWLHAGDACINEQLQAAQVARNAKRSSSAGTQRIGDDWVLPRTIQQPLNLLEEERFRWLQQKRSVCGGVPCDGGSGAGVPVDGEPDIGRSESDVVRMRIQTAEDIRSFAQNAQPGSVPAGLLRLAGDLLAPARIPWQAKLAHAVRRAVRFRAGAVLHNYGRPSRRQAGLGTGPGTPRLPALHAPVPNVAFLLDTSGSMTADHLRAGLIEANGVLRALGATITFVANDADVHAVEEVGTVDAITKFLKGGGGTDLRPGFAALMARRVRPDIVIVVTDGCIGAGYPEVPPPFHTVWVVIGSYECPCPWGDQVRLEIDDDGA